MVNGVPESGQSRTKPRYAKGKSIKIFGVEQRDQWLMVRFQGKGEPQDIVARASFSICVCRLFVSLIALDA